VFGLAVCIVRAATPDDAIEIVDASRFGNGSRCAGRRADTRSSGPEGWRSRSEGWNEIAKVRG
jgi:acyl-CoA reductase-like NAD-dependent aldehyde dehydrogenase